MLNIPDEVRTIAVNCLQFGDTGKGKVIDLLGADWADIIIRGTGGANAGHSVCFNGKTSIFHLLPSGILHDAAGMINIIGSGTAIDPRLLCEEIAQLGQQGLSCDNLVLALNARITLPTQIVRDRIGDGKRIGTTGRGIGPTYSDHVSRIGLVVNDLLNADILAKKVEANVEFSKRILSSYDPAVVKEILFQPNLCDGNYYYPEKMFDIDAIVETYLHYGGLLDCFIRDADAFAREVVGGQKILLEGAQGALLDIDHGTYPFVTSSSCTVDGLAKGAGLNSACIDLSLGILKGFYETRVGEGPFPTEFGGENSAAWCRNASKEEERKKYAAGAVTVNDEDEFLRGIAIRQVGDEYGATTGRPRRIGRLDLPLLRLALKWGSNDVILTKLDVLDGCDEIQVCHSYVYRGRPYRHGSRLLTDGDILCEAIPAAEVLKYCIPEYRNFPGWKKSIRGITDFEDLPNELKFILNVVKMQTGINPKIISVGPDRKETIFV